MGDILADVTYRLGFVDYLCGVTPPMRMNIKRTIINIIHFKGKMYCHYEWYFESVFTGEPRKDVS